MEFDKSRVYTTLNAYKLRIGSKCIFADTLGALSAKVQRKEYKDFITILKRIYDDGFCNRFDTGDDLFCFAYLIESPSKPMKYMPFESVEKAMDAAKKHGGWVKDKKNNVRLLVVGFEEDDVFVLGNGYCCSYINLFLDYVFADDGSPCGELVEERDATYSDVLLQF